MGQPRPWEAFEELADYRQITGTVFLNSENIQLGFGSEPKGNSKLHLDEHRL
jgi:hypothetical protein